MIKMNEEINGLMKQRRKAREKVKQLQNNWNELKKWLKSIGLTGVVLKMQELEQGKDE